MVLITKVFLLAVGILGVYAVPQFAGNDAVDQSFFRMIVARMGSPLIESRALSPAEKTCGDIYNNATNKIYIDLTNDTTKCVDEANRTNTDNDKTSNATVTTIRNQSLTLEQNLQRCKNITDNKLYLNCTISHFDSSLQLLDSSNTLALLVSSQFETNATVVQAQRSNCISAAVSKAKVKLIETANDYNTCLAKAQLQRQVPQEKHQEKEKPEEHPKPLHNESEPAKKP
ncbi:uncharacterized protein LOC115633938 [Scaptodrosophila lebanonensis]|uniref:Uncharacterized protein LOC115633938 n=1 Tax=Drosophila lebanonensis TaxID=7225 RepID=A0A6J2UFU8_DROLE|nr:uncharacterized protein LOC115633938 [Scaptodrosophila lebanonensis]